MIGIPMITWNATHREKDSRIMEKPQPIAYATSGAYLRQVNYKAFGVTSIIVGIVSLLICGISIFAARGAISIVDQDQRRGTMEAYMDEFQTRHDSAMYAIYLATYLLIIALAWLGVWYLLHSPTDCLFYLGVIPGGVASIYPVVVVVWLCICHSQRCGSS